MNRFRAQFLAFVVGSGVLGLQWSLRSYDQLFEVAGVIGLVFLGMLYGNLKTSDDHFYGQLKTGIITTLNYLLILLLFLVCRFIDLGAHPEHSYNGFWGTWFGFLLGLFLGGAIVALLIFYAFVLFFEIEHRERSEIGDSGS